MRDSIKLLVAANEEAPFVSIIDLEHIEKFMEMEGVVEKVWYKEEEPIALYLARVGVDWCEPVEKLFEIVVYIKPEFRNKGVAKEISLYAESLVKDRGIKEIIAGVTLDINKKQAEEFYLKRGFSLFGKSFKRVL